jgi:hypothetical protein
MTVEIIRYNPPVPKLDKAALSMPAQELGVGTHDVTPPGYKSQYVVTVIDRGDRDPVGWVTITSGKGSPLFTITTLEQAQHFRNLSGVTVVPLDQSRNMAVLATQRGSKVPQYDGVVYYRPKNQ